MARSTRLTWSGYVLGFSLGGLFDGILLHQVLQWHHLLINVRGEAMRDIRVQILADGLFHALMYVIAVAGLIMLFRARHELTAPASGRLLAASVLIGFGVWNVVDIASAHWMLGIHRVRIDTPSPMLYDLAWFAAFGFVPIAIGWMLRRGANAEAASSRGAAVASMLVAVVAGAGAVSLLPPRDSSQVVAYFAPSRTPADIVAAAAAANARVLWSDKSNRVWAFALPPDARGWELYRHGAIVVSSAIGAGCLSWLRAG